MSELRFDWDPKKSKANQRKHGVSFEEARSVFSDEHALLIDDPEHSEDEDRFVLLGMSGALRLLIVCHCYRADGDVIAQGRPTRAAGLHTEVEQMKKRYDFSSAKPNPYAKRLKKQVTIRLDQESLAYFQGLAEETGIPYQTLINLYLRDCAASGKRLQLQWRPRPEKGAA